MAKSYYEKEEAGCSPSNNLHSTNLNNDSSAVEDTCPGDFNHPYTPGINAAIRGAFHQSGIAQPTIHASCYGPSFNVEKSLDIADGPEAVPMRNVRKVYLGTPTSPAPDSPLPAVPAAALSRRTHGSGYLPLGDSNSGNGLETTLKNREPQQVDLSKEQPVTSPLLTSFVNYFISSSKKLPPKSISDTDGLGESRPVVTQPGKNTWPVPGKVEAFHHKSKKAANVLGIEGGSYDIACVHEAGVDPPPSPRAPPGKAVEILGIQPDLYDLPRLRAASGTSSPTSHDQRSPFRLKAKDGREGDTVDRIVEHYNDESMRTSELEYNGLRGDKYATRLLAPKDEFEHVDLNDDPESDDNEANFRGLALLRNTITSDANTATFASARRDGASAAKGRNRFNEPRSQVNQTPTESLFQSRTRRPQAYTETSEGSTSYGHTRNLLMLSDKSASPKPSPGFNDAGLTNYTDGGVSVNSNLRERWMNSPSRNNTASPAALTSMSQGQPKIELGFSRLQVAPRSLERDVSDALRRDSAYTFSRASVDNSATRKHSGDNATDSGEDVEHYVNVINKDGNVVPERVINSIGFYDSSALAAIPFQQESQRPKKEIKVSIYGHRNAFGLDKLTVDTSEANGFPSTTAGGDECNDWETVATMKTGGRPAPWSDVEGDYQQAGSSIADYEDEEEYRGMQGNLGYTKPDLQHYSSREAMATHPAAMGHTHDYRRREVPDSLGNRVPYMLPSYAVKTAAGGFAINSLRTQEMLPYMEYTREENHRRQIDPHIGSATTDQEVIDEMARRNKDRTKKLCDINMKRNPSNPYRRLLEESNRGDKAKIEISPATGVYSLSSPYYAEDPFIEESSLPQMYSSTPTTGIDDASKVGTATHLCTPMHTANRAIPQESEPVRNHGHGVWLEGARRDAVRAEPSTTAKGGDQTSSGHPSPSWIPNLGHYEERVKARLPDLQVRLRADGDVEQAKVPVSISKPFNPISNGRSLSRSATRRAPIPLTDYGTESTMIEHVWSPGAKPLTHFPDAVHPDRALQTYEDPFVADRISSLPTNAPSLRSPGRASYILNKPEQDRLSTIFLILCCLFPPFLVLYTRGFFDFAIFHASRGRVGTFGRTHKKWAMWLGVVFAVVIVMATALLIVFEHFGALKSKV